MADWALPVISDQIQIATPNSGDTVVAQAGTIALIINNAAILAVVNVTLPPNPVDGQRFVVCSAAVITLLNMSAPSATIKGAVAGLSANGYARYGFSAVLGAWFRTG